MAKKSRKDENLPDHLERIKRHLCLHCGKRPARRGLYCSPCGESQWNLMRQRRARHPIPTREQWQALYDTLDPDN